MSSMAGERIHFQWHSLQVPNPGDSTRTGIVGWVLLCLVAVFPVAACSTTVTGHGAGQGTRTSLSCGIGWVRVDQGPFCYPLPEGFFKSSTLPDYATDWLYRTLVRTTQRVDQILVSATPNVVNADLDANERLSQRFSDTQALKAGTGHILRVVSTDPVKLDGHRAFHQIAQYEDGTVVDYTVAYAGRLLVAVVCYGYSNPHAVRLACDEVRTHIQIVGVG